MAQQAQMRGKLAVISGPSGVGKSTICRELAKRTDAYLSVSATTRARSPQETDGVDYWFISRDEFLDKVQKKQFLEYAEVFGNLYGTPHDRVEQAINAGKTVILEIDLQGGIQAQQRYPDAIRICILPPNVEDLSKRINGRARDSAETVRKRLEASQREIADVRQFYKYMVVNDNLEDAINEVMNIIRSDGITK